MTKTETISILGCGWLGMPLAQRLLQLGYQVKGATTQTGKLGMLKENKIQPFLIHLNPDINADFDPAFFESEILLVNIPPGRRQADVAAFYPAQMEALVNILQHSSVQKVLFVSSTSVYPDLNREVREEDARQPAKASGEALLQAEQLFYSHPRFQTTILRFCGLYGADRNPGRFLSGKTIATSGEAGVNLIHLEDCLQIMIRVIREQVWGEVFNACSDKHPAKKEYYSRAAGRAGLQPPQFSGQEAENFKIINSDKLKKQLNYNFIYPDPMQADA